MLKLPLSSSPEIFDNTRRAFLMPNSNYDLMSLKMLFLALGGNGRQPCGNTPSAAKWPTRPGNWATGTSPPTAPCCSTNKRPCPAATGISPTSWACIRSTSSPPRADAATGEIIAASLKQWDAIGTSAWCGYSFSWMAALRARVGDAEAALRHLDIYTRAFILRNGFHANGDQTKSGFSGLTYRPFTLEGNFLAMDAVHEMLLQSWSPAPGTRRRPAVIRIFPATPWRWHEASFDDLRAEGGHRVSARRENNATTWFRIVAGRDGPLRIRDNFGGREPQWSRGEVTKSATISNSR